MGNPLRRFVDMAGNEEPEDDPSQWDINQPLPDEPAPEPQPVPEPPPKIEPPDYSRRDQLRQRIDDILNTPKAPFLEQNRGRYMELQSLAGLLGEEDRSANQEYQRKINEQNMYGKNRYQKVGGNLYDTMLGRTLLGADQSQSYLAALARGETSRDVQGLRNQGALDTQDARNQGNLDVAGARGQTAVDVQGMRGDTATTVQGMRGDTALGVQGMRSATALGVAGMPVRPRTSASSGADNSAIPKLPSDTQKRVNAIVSDPTLSDQDKGNQLDEVLFPLGLAWSRLQKTIVRKPGFMGGVRGTVPAGVSTPQPTVNTPEPSVAGPQEGDIQQNKVTGAKRIFQNGAWVAMSG